MSIIDIVFYFILFIFYQFQPKEYLLLQMLTQQTAKIWKKTKRIKLKNKSTRAEENKSSVSGWWESVRAVALEEL